MSECKEMIDTRSVSVVPRWFLMKESMIHRGRHTQEVPLTAQVARWSAGLSRVSANSLDPIESRARFSTHPSWSFDSSHDVVVEKSILSSCNSAIPAFMLPVLVTRGK